MRRWKDVDILIQRRAGAMPDRYTFKDCAITYAARGRVVEIESKDNTQVFPIRLLVSIYLEGPLDS